MISVYPTQPNKACTGQVGTVRFFRHFSLDSPPGQAGFEFFLLPSIVHARPPASNANRWAALD